MSSLLYGAVENLYKWEFCNDLLKFKIQRCEGSHSNVDYGHLQKSSGWKEMCLVFEVLVNWWCGVGGRERGGGRVCGSLGGFLIAGGVCIFQ